MNLSLRRWNDGVRSNFQDDKYERNESLLNVSIAQFSMKKVGLESNEIE
jgi:hypothetical protein